ncbi:MAG: hypothetical protein IJ463_08120 [Bacilli bacterium]|nr:hypothetical protein [Bacilli bacterium]
MGVLEKIKNALFEVEYVEVDEPPKKEKKAKVKEKTRVEEKTEEVVDKPIAKKIVLPGRKEEKVEIIEEEELVDQDFEARPIEETVKENLNNKFNYMDEEDLIVEEEYENSVPEIVKVLDDEVSKPKVFEQERTRRSSHTYEDEILVSKEDNFESHYGINKPSNISRESKPYGMDKSLSVQVHEYGSYDRKEEKSGFKPSPIISPIYGILDKNYKKEDVVQKKEVRLSSGYSRGSLNVDAVRNKAYGDTEKKEEVPVKEVPVTTFEVEEEEEENLLVDLSDEKDKPEVKEITMGDALEYFQDLGLEYNVDYVDASKEKTVQRRVKEDNEIETALKDTMEDTLNKEKIDVVIPEEEKFKPIEIKDESNGKAEITLDDDDNLFDLIDSMYQESD